MSLPTSAPPSLQQHSFIPGSSLQSNPGATVFESAVLSHFKTTAPILFQKETLSKRLFDILFSLGALVVCVPIFGFIWIGIRLSSPGKVLFCQPRLGQGGKIFNCYKFRTMYPDSERILRNLLKENPSLKKEWDQKQKLSHDPRVFPFGRFLRMTSLDELPQFFNVLKGELSVVGPRPYLIQQKRLLGPLATKILSVKPGITGLWQTVAREQTTFYKRMKLDAYYISKKSFWLDLKLIIKTIPIIFLGKSG